MSLVRITLCITVEISLVLKQVFENRHLWCYVWKYIPLCVYLSLETGEIVGQPLSSHCVLFDGEDVQKQFYMCHVFKIT